MSAEKLFLIDGHALCYRSFYAIRELRNSKGQATNAVYGFISTLRKILRDFEPKYCAVCFDAKGKTFRSERLAEYKIQRAPMPDDLISQIPIIKEVVSAFNIAHFECEGYEADDIMATLAKQYSKKDLEVVLVTDDKDMYQLIDNSVKMFSVRKDAILDKNDIEEKIGFSPEHIIDFIGLAGDKADNIPGVAGIGEVTARKLINEYGSLDNILNNLSELKESIQKKLEAEEEMATLSRELAILDEKVPIKQKIVDLKVEEPDKAVLFKLFRDLEFKRLTEEFRTQELFAPTVESSSVNDKELKKIEKSLKSDKLCLICTDDEGQVYVAGKDLKVFQIQGKQFEILKSVLKDKNTLKIVHNLKDLLKKLSLTKSDIDGKIFDNYLAAYLSGATTKLSASELAWGFLEETISDESPADHLVVYKKLYDYLQKDLKASKLESLLDDIEIPLSFVLSQMEEEGVSLDTKLLAKLSKDCQKRIDTITTKLFEISGEEFNINSPKQLGVVLFDKLGLPVIKKTKTGYSTDESVLTTLSLQHEFPSMILEYRQLAKLKSTYIDALPKLINEKTGKIHAEFNQIGAETGRLSSRNPNLQNIPIRTDLGRQIRKAFIPSKKTNVIVAADYSQIELRILAHLAEDPELIKAFNEGQDIHQYTASLIFDVDQKDVDSDMRNTAKRVNFGIVYGMSAFGLAKDLKITNGEAQEFIDKYFIRYPKVKDFMDREIAFCEENGYVLTLFKRRRYIADINSKNMGVRQFAQRQAINTPVQGSAADMIKLAMINTQKYIEDNKLKSKMIITVHDELVFDVPKVEKDMISKCIIECMEKPFKLSVPISVSIKTGPNWLEMKEG